MEAQREMTDSEMLMLAYGALKAKQAGYAADRQSGEDIVITILERYIFTATPPIIICDPPKENL